MAIRTVCSSCGRTLSFPDGEAGLPALCNACGKRLTVPVQAPESAGQNDGLAPADTGLPWRLLAIVGGCALATGLVLFIWRFAFHNHANPSPQQQETPSIVQQPQDNKPKPDTVQIPATMAAAAPSTTEPTSAEPAATQPVRVALLPPPQPVVIHKTSGRESEPNSSLHIVKSHSHITAVPGSISDDEIGRTIQKGVDFLIGEFGTAHVLSAVSAEGGAGRGRGFRRGGNSESGGLDALAVLALIQCGDAVHDPRLNINGEFMSGCVAEMRKLDMGRVQTYGRALRATALAMLNRKEDYDCLHDDVKYLLASQYNGGYSYVKSDGQYDNSNSQYGLLGVWAGAEVGVEVPLNYWQKVEQHWASCQIGDGEWGYVGPGGGRLSMTLAGVASLFVTHDYLDAVKFDGAVGRDPFSKPLAKGLNWLETGDHIVDNERRGGNPGYTLYGIERVGLASGFKFFGAHDWYRELARDVVDEQEGNGSWDGGNIVDTCYNLLFLSRGRHPVMMNKLRFDGYWANRPRDIANLARFASHELERPINWQVVSIDHDWPDWTDSPILYLASHQAIKLTDEQIDKIREFVLAGGLLYTQADGNSPQFNAFAEQLAQKLFPSYEMKTAPPDSDLYTLIYKVKGWPSSLPPLKLVSNGSRILMIHSPTDLAMAWQQRAEKSKEAIFQLGVNIFIYAAGKSDLRNRLNSPYIPPQQVHSGGKVRLARLKYAGNWDPEPGAYVRFTRWMAHETSLTLEVKTVEMAQLSVDSAPVAHLTGTYRYTPTDAEIKALRQYVEGGGTLIIDDCGGNNAFNLSLVNDFLPRAFGQMQFKMLAANHPLRLGKMAGMDDLTARAALRPFTVAQMGQGAGVIEIGEIGKGHVIYSSFDIISGLLGTKTWGILGYDPDYCQSLMKNVILWTAYGAKD